MKSLGFPRMHKEKNEKRDFMPSFFESFVDYDVEIFLEFNYGSQLEYSEQDYLKKNPKIKFVNNRDCYTKDIVIALRCPEINELNWLEEGSILVSMLHYATRPTRVKYLKKRNIFGVSMDSARNDLLDRIVVDYRGTSGNGIKIAFEELAKNIGKCDISSRPLNVSIIGMGMVGLMAARAAGKYGSMQNSEFFEAKGLQPVIVNILSRNITSNKEIMRKLFSTTDILVDASNRDDATEYIVENCMLSHLPEHSVILDLSADPYLLDTQPIQVKAIEGIPGGSLDKYVFYTEDKEYLDIPKSVDTTYRRTVVSCNAWPGVSPESCMKLYGLQLTPIIQLLIKMEKEEFCDNHGDFFARVIHRSTLQYFEKPM